MQLNGPELGDNHALYYDTYTVILRVSCAFGSPQLWAAVVRDDDHMTIHQMSGLTLDNGKYFFIKKISNNWEGVRWADAFRRFRADVLNDYARGIAKSEGTEDIPPEAAEMVTMKTMTCMEFVVFLIDQGQLSPEVLL